MDTKKMGALYMITHMRSPSDVKPAPTSPTTSGSTLHTPGVWVGQHGTAAGPFAGLRAQVATVSRSDYGSHQPSYPPMGVATHGGCLHFSWQHTALRTRCPSNGSSVVSSGWVSVPRQCEKQKQHKRR